MEIAVLVGVVSVAAALPLLMKAVESLKTLVQGMTFFVEAWEGLKQHQEKVMEQLKHLQQFLGCANWLRPRHPVQYVHAVKILSNL